MQTMYHNYKNTRIYITMRSGGWVYAYYPSYRKGEYSLEFPSIDLCKQAAEEQIDGKRGRYGRLIAE
jgi:hypothetical protein